MLLIIKLHDFGLFWAVYSVIVGLYTIQKRPKLSRFASIIFHFSVFIFFLYFTSWPVRV